MFLAHSMPHVPLLAQICDPFFVCIGEYLLSHSAIALLYPSLAPICIRWPEIVMECLLELDSILEDQYQRNLIFNWYNASKSAKYFRRIINYK